MSFILFTIHYFMHYLIRLIDTKYDLDNMYYTVTCHTKERCTMQLSYIHTYIHTCVHPLTFLLSSDLSSCIVVACASRPDPDPCTHSDTSAHIFRLHSVQNT